MLMLCDVLVLVNFIYYLCYVPKHQQCKMKKKPAVSPTVGNQQTKRAEPHKIRLVKQASNVQIRKIKVTLISLKAMYQLLGKAKVIHQK